MCAYICVLWNVKTKARPIICVGVCVYGILEYIAYHVFLEKGVPK